MTTIRQAVPACSFHARCRNVREFRKSSMCPEARVVIDILSLAAILCGELICCSVRGTAETKRWQDQARFRVLCRCSSSFGVYSHPFIHLSCSAPLLTSGPSVLVYEASISFLDCLLEQAATGLKHHSHVYTPPAQGTTGLARNSAKRWVGGSNPACSG